MQTAKSLIILSILALLPKTIAQPMAETPPTEPTTTSKSHVSHARTASCLLKVTADSEVVPLSMSTIQYLLEGPAVAGKAAREILGIASIQGTPPFEIKVEQLPGPAASRVLPTGLSRTHAPRLMEPTAPTQSDPLPSSMIKHPDDAQPASNADETTQKPSNTGRTVRSTSSTRTSPKQNTSYGSAIVQTYNPTPRSRSTTTRYRASTSASRNYDETAPGGYYSYSSRPKAAASRTVPLSTATQKKSQTQTIFCRLKLDITDESAEPAAGEILNALIENLRNVLESASADYSLNLKNEIDFARRDRDSAQKQLSEITARAQSEISIPQRADDPFNVNVKRQLDEIVDLSSLKPEMSFSEALEVMKNAVDPPLEIVVLWADLYDNASIDKTTETNMDALSRVPLHKALSLLLKAVSNCFSKELTYSISSGVITIATEASLPRDMVAIVYEIPGLVFSGTNAMELADVIMQTIEPHTWLEIEGLGEGTIAPYSANKLVVRQTIDVHLKIRSFLQDVLKTDSPPSIPLEIPPETFVQERLELQRQKHILEMDVARLKARTAAVEQAVAKTTEAVARKLQDDSVTKELEKILEINANLLKVAKQRFESGTASAAEIQQMEEKLARARIELAKRREELSLAAGGSELADFNSQLTAIAIDLAEKTAELQVINTQLSRTETQLAMATTLDPQLQELRYAKQTFEAARQKLNELEIRLANLTPPTVTIIGAH